MLQAVSALRNSKALAPLACRAASTAAPKLMTATLSCEGERATTTASKDGKTWLVDEPKKLGGRDEGPSPLATFLSGLLGCEQFTAFVVAKEMGIKFEKCSWSASAPFDIAAHMGKPGHDYAGFTEIKVEGKVHETDATDEQLAELAAKVEKRCILAATLHKTGIPMSCVLTKA
ncbi:unnamed protein product [Pedinophyceae sp. YPF-701]|nr:unnamed protein product [Pedinophyceae sp. YPF-701]